jgi:hypothetical protein
MSADQIRERRHVLIDYNDDGNATYGDILEVRRGNYAQWLFMRDGQLDDPQMRSLAVKLLTQQLDAT